MACWRLQTDWQWLEWHRLRHFIWFDTALHNRLSHAVLAPKTCEDFDVLIVKYSCVRDSSVVFFLCDGRRDSCVWMRVDEGINIPVSLVLLQQEARCSICHVNGERPAGSDYLQQYHLIQQIWHTVTKLLQLFTAILGESLRIYRKFGWFSQ